MRARPRFAGVTRSPDAPHAGPDAAPPNPEGPPPVGSSRGRLLPIVFESDTAAGRAFDLSLIALILLSVAVVSVETVRGLPPAAYRTLRTAEWTLTLVFTAVRISEPAITTKPSCAG